MSCSCPLCHSNSAIHYFTDKKRDYWQCQLCHLVFVKSEQHLCEDDEKAIYDTHENDITDIGYQKFLSRAVNPLLANLTVTSQGLDFGCGPGPALAKMVESYGHSVALYDIFYYPKIDVLEEQYDFITCTEAIEHFTSPAKEWRLLIDMLKPQGVLVIMTKLVLDKQRFANWHYKNDLTHVSFFSKKTFDHLAQQENLSVEYIGNDVMLFKKP